MRTKAFDLNVSQMVTTISPSAHVFQIPTLPAYAIDYAILYVNSLGNTVDGLSINIENDKIQWRLDAVSSYPIDIADTCRLEIRYHGIRDFKLLFPRVMATDPDRAERLGLYYQEMEICFDNAAWLSFALMASAIFEHLLFFSINGASHTLSALNNNASQRRIITRSEYDIIDNIRNYRNVIHCNRMRENYIERKDALDARTLIEKLIERL